MEVGPNPAPRSGSRPPLLRLHSSRALGHFRRGGAEKQLSCSHFLIVVFEAPGSRAEPFAVPAPRLLEGGVASDGGGATPCRGGEGALGGGAAGPAAAPECGTPAPRAAGPGDQRASRPAVPLPPTCPRPDAMARVPPTGQFRFRVGRQWARRAGSWAPAVDVGGERGLELAGSGGGHGDAGARG